MNNLEKLISEINLYIQDYYRVKGIKDKHIGYLSIEKALRYKNEKTKTIVYKVWYNWADDRQLVYKTEHTMPMNFTEAQAEESYKQAEDMFYHTLLYQAMPDHNTKDSKFMSALIDGTYKYPFKY